VSQRRRESGKPAAKRRKKTSLASTADLRIIGIPVSGEITPGDSITNKLLQSLRQNHLALKSGDILVVKHKIISKAEGQIVDLATIKPSADSIAWAKKYKLDARVIELPCFCPPIPTAPLAGSLAKSRTAPGSLSQFSSLTHSAVPGARALWISALAWLA
jgi:hypothetical protein